MAKLQRYSDFAALKADESPSNLPAAQSHKLHAEFEASLNSISKAMVAKKKQEAPLRFAASR